MKSRVALLFLLIWTAFAAWSADWTQWRGPNRDGVSAETGLLEEWPPGGPPLAWKTEGLGEGYASFSVAGGRLFTQGQREGRQYVMAFDEKTGKKLWETANGEAFRDRRGGGPRGTPTVDGDRLYALGANGNLICLDPATGKTIWESPLLSRFGAGNIRWGISESPLIDAERIIVNPGGPGASVVALNKNNGELIWKAGGDRAGYSSAMIAEAGGIRHYVVLTGKAGVGIRADNGKVLWRYKKVSNTTANVATPIVRDNYVFLSSDYGTGGGLLELTASGDGVKAEEVYFNRDMRNHYSSAVLVGDYLYGYSSRILTCMNFKTGEVVWRDRSVGKGQVIYAQGDLYLLGENGVVGLAEATPEGYQEKSRFEIGRGNYPTWTLPVIANGKLFLRDQDTLSCYNITAK